MSVEISVSKLDRNLFQYSHTMNQNNLQPCINNNNSVTRISTRDKTMEVSAVLVSNAYKCYESGTMVINNLNMNVPSGCIYSLLGPSGCGKTTVLSCILGLRTLTSGNISVFGQKPGTKESGIPGHSVGYMPQELALHDVFTIKEVLQYFGTLYAMTKTEINARMQFLIGFLDLPNSDQLLRSLSGGQQRRLSLAICLLHEPPLLILDEPTAGVDPLLRENIWNHLEGIVRKQRTTILITTHYIEEAKRASMVGIMRKGRLLVADKSPQELLEQYHTLLLEQVFLKLCVEDDDNASNCSSVSTECCSKTSSFLSGDGNQKTIKGLSFQSIEHEHPSNEEFSHNQNRKVYKSWESAVHHLNKVRALLFKNLMFLVRTPWLGLGLLLLPPFQMTTFISVLGYDPKNIVLGLVDPEIPVGHDVHKFCNSFRHDTCFSHNVTSCHFLTRFPRETFEWVNHKSEEDALASAQRGLTWGFLSIPSNFTQHMSQRFLMRNHADNETLDGSSFKGRLDMSFNLKSDFIKQHVYEYFQAFVMDLAASCGSDPKMVEIPLNFNAIYGELDSKYLPYMLPGFYALTIILLPMATAFEILKDIKAGTHQRTMVTGVHFFHYLIALLIIDGGLLAVQTLSCYLIMVFGADFQVQGSVFLFLSLGFLVGMVGLHLGFLIAHMVDEEIGATFVTLGIYLPLMVSSGGTWPYDGMPRLAQVIYSCSPTAIPIKALRAISSRGWGLEHEQVWWGFVVAILWIIILWIISAIIRRMRNK